MRKQGTFKDGIASLIPSVLKFLSFSGCIAIKGLPFDMWNEETFKYSGQQSGGLQDIEQNTKNFSNLSESESKLMPHPLLQSCHLSILKSNHN